MVSHWNYPWVADYCLSNADLTPGKASCPAAKAPRREYLLCRTLKLLHTPLRYMSTAAQNHALARFFIINITVHAHLQRWTSWEWCTTWDSLQAESLHTVRANRMTQICVSCGAFHCVRNVTAMEKLTAMSSLNRWLVFWNSWTDQAFSIWLVPNLTLKRTLKWSVTGFEKSWI